MQSHNNIKAILFDLDGTLRHHLPTGGEVFTEYAIRLGLNITQEDRRRAAIWEHYYFAGSPEIQTDQKLFKEERDEFWFRFAHRRLVALGCPPAFVPEFGPKLAEYMRENYKPDVLIPEETHTVIPKLRESGYTLGVVSNRDNPYKDELNDFGMGEYFHFSLAAGEVNSWKPDSGVFKHALKMSGTTPEQTLYIGDNYFADVIGARRSGLQPVLYDPKRLFRNMDCPVIVSFNELLEMVK